MRDGPAIGLGPNRSASRPTTGADAAIDTVMAAKADDTASRDHENSSERGLSNTANVSTKAEPKNTPTPDPATTRQPWYRKLSSFTVLIRYPPIRRTWTLANGYRRCPEYAVVWRSVTAELRDVFARISAIAAKVLAHDAGALLVCLPDDLHGRVYASSGFQIPLPEVLEIPEDLRTSNWDDSIVDDTTKETEPRYARLVKMGLHSILRARAASTE